MINTCSVDPLPGITLVKAKSDSATGGFELAGSNHDEFFRDSPFNVLYTLVAPVEQDVEEPPK
jgi:hypothetical protein